MTWRDEIDGLLGVRPDFNARWAKSTREPIPLADGPAVETRTKPRRRVFHDHSKTSNARKTLAALPAPGESHHFLLRGEYDAFDLVDVMLELAGPVDVLHLATLGFNSANATRLVGMLDAGRVGRACLLVSCYYKADRKEADVCDKLETTLPARGGWFAVARSHCKVVTAGPLCIESSANLRGCSTLEQMTLTNDMDLADFHRGWMERVNAETKARKAKK